MTLEHLPCDTNSSMNIIFEHRDRHILVVYVGKFSRSTDGNPIAKALTVKTGVQWPR